MITDNQTNKVYFSPRLMTECPKLWASIRGALSERKIRYGLLTYPNYMWCRDYMPIQIEEENFVAYRFEPDYLKNDRRYRRFLDCDGYRICKEIGYSMTEMDLVMDGGNVVKCGDTIIMTEKIFAENKDKSRIEVERILHEKLKSDILFLPWDRDEMYGHSDGIVHFAGNNCVLMTNYEDFDQKLAKEMEKRLKRKFEVIQLHYQTRRKHLRSWSYINFLQTERLIMVPQLGTEEDEQALEQISAVFPDCETIGVPALEAVRKGGALNCISWNVKDNGTIPIKLESLLPDVLNLFVHLGDSVLSDKVFDPLKRFLNDRCSFPRRGEIIAMNDYLDRKKAEMKQISSSLNYGTHLSEEESRQWDYYQSWQIVLSVLPVFVCNLRECLIDAPFEFSE